MKNALAILIFMFQLAISAKSQRLSVDLMPGLMNYGGNLQTRGITYIEAQFGFEVGLEYRLSDKFGLRGDYLTGKLEGSDKFATNSFDINRNLSSTTLINEVSLSLEYDIFKLRIDKIWTPYVFAGVGVFQFNPYTTDTAGNLVYLQPLGTEGEGLPQYPDRKLYALTQVNIPLGFGIKYAISSDITVGFEVGFRKLFTDYLDDVSTTYPDEATLLAARGPEAVELSFRGNELNPALPFPSGQNRGNPTIKKDFYYTGLFRFNYTFSSYRNSSSYRYRKGVACPKYLL